MKFLKLFLLLYFMLNNQLVLTQEFNVMSYNLRYDNANDNENWWGHRKEAVVDLIKDNNLLVFGVQEAVLSQMEYIDTNLSDYNFVGVGRDDGKEAGRNR